MTFFFPSNTRGLQPRKFPSAAQNSGVEIKARYMTIQNTAYVLKAVSEQSSDRWSIGLAENFLDKICAQMKAKGRGCRSRNDNK